MQNDKEKFKKEFIQRLIKFSVNSIRFCEDLRKQRNLMPIADQFIRSSTSVGANVIEAKASSSRRDYIRFFEIALKSANETKYWLIVIRESANKTANFENLLAKLIDEADQIAKIIGSSLLTLKNKK